jgi:hypothetical protein
VYGSEQIIATTCGGDCFIEVWRRKSQKKVQQPFFEGEKRAQMWKCTNWLITVGTVTVCHSIIDTPDFLFIFFPPKITVEVASQCAVMKYTARAS